MTKKLIASILCASIALSSTAMATEKKYTDIDNNNTVLTTALEKLEKFNIVKGYEDGTFKPKNNITRAEFAVMARRMVNPDNYIGEVGGYTLNQATGELERDHFALNEINLLLEMKAISGYENGEIKPDQNITYYEGAKILICMLGYNDDAIQNGGWSEGYIKCAKEIGLLEGIFEKDYSKYATRADSAIMINNAFSTPRKLISVCDVGKSIADTPEGVYFVDGVVTETVQGMTFEEILKGIYVDNGSIVNENIVEQELSLDEKLVDMSFSQKLYGGGLPESISYGDSSKIYIDEEKGSITIYFTRINKSCDYYITLNSMYDQKYYRMPSKEEYEQNPMIFADLRPPNVFKVGPISTDKFTLSDIPRGVYRVDGFSLPCVSEILGVVVVEGDETDKVE